MKLYTLLIGINKYPSPNQLSGCVGDATKMQTYLTSIATDTFEVQTPILLTNEAATKKEIANAIRKITKKLKDEDTFLFYFSGHGTRELSEGRFKEDHNGWLETIVCHYEDGDKNFLLADKELRYLFHDCKSKAHIVTIFDCCHSGDIMRGEEEVKKQVRRISTKQPQRPYKHFLFKRKRASNFKKKWFDEVFPDANILTISACQSDESSWEGDNGGYFTNALLKVLEESNGVLNYNELTKKVEIAIRKSTSTTQTPTIGIQGNRQFNQLTSWLRLNGDQLLNGAGFIQHNANEGWIYSKGSLMGVKAGDSIKIRIGANKEVNLAISEASLKDAIVKVGNADLDKNQTYPVISELILGQPKIYINDEDNDADLYKMLEDSLKGDKNIILVDKQSESNFQINIFNQSIYYSFPSTPYQPLHRQLDLMSNVNADKTPSELAATIEAHVEHWNEILDKWHYLRKLEKHDDFTGFPIKVELKFANKNQWIDITNGKYSFKATQPNGITKWTSEEFEIRVTNKYPRKLYVTPLTAFYAKFEIAAGSFFNNRSELLNPNSAIVFKAKRLWLDDFQEVYNWSGEVAFLKFIVSTKTDLTISIADLIQDGFKPPITLPVPDDVNRGGGDASAIQKGEKWGVYTSELQLPNPTVNQISGSLKETFDAYQADELLSSFIERLYFDLQPALNNGYVAKPNAAKEKGLKMWLGNVIDHGKRKRLFKKSKKKFPEKGIVIAEGDSWFLYPVLVKDTIDYVMEKWPVKSLAWAGDTLANYKKSGQLLKQVAELKPKYVLLSGGGNDIIGPDIQKILKKNATNVDEPSDYLNPSKYGPKMNQLRAIYKYFFEEISKADSVEKILVHGYDYVRADHAMIVTKDGWVNKYMKKKGITDVEERKKLIIYLIDQFNGLLKSLAKDFPKVTYINARTVVGDGEWYDEIHPNDDGFKKVADLFLAEMR